jgi:hypothetical protein
MPDRPSRGVARALRDPWLAASLIGFACLLALVASFGRDAGITWDEGFQLQYGQRVLAWFRSGFRDRGALEYLDLYLYGGLFDAPAQWIVERSPLDPYETRHLLTALTALLGIVGTWWVAAAVGGSRAGFCAAATLALTPAWIGHGLFNPKDVPFATAAVFVTWTAQRIALGPWPPRVRDALIAGVAVGAALGVRPGGVFLLSYPFAAGLARGVLAYLDARRGVARIDMPAQPKVAPSLVSMIASTALPLLSLVPVAWIVMISAWPWAQLDPIARPIDAMVAASHFNWLGESLFEGKRVLSTELPARYLFVWFGITLPELYWIAAAAGLACLALSVRGRKKSSAPEGRATALGLAMIACSVVLPLTAALLTRPTLYDAHRHFLFLFPPLAALAGLSIAAFIADLRIWKSLRAAVFGAWCIAAISVAIAIVQLHPYEYAFFNRSVGGLAGAVGRYETDYWGASYREGLAWVIEHVHPTRPLRVATCDQSSSGRVFYYLQHWPNAAAHFSVVERAQDADLFLATTRWDCHRRVAAEVIHVVERQGAPLLYVLHPTR